MPLRANIRRIRLALAAISSEVDHLEEQLTKKTVEHAWAITPKVPPGYDTVLGYLAKNHPDVLDSFDYSDPEVTQRDGFWLTHRCKERGISPFYVDAPACFAGKGITHVNAYPIAVLAERWGDMDFARAG